MGNFQPVAMLEITNNMGPERPKKNLKESSEIISSLFCVFSSFSDHTVSCADKDVGVSCNNDVASSIDLDEDI